MYRVFFGLDLQYKDKQLINSWRENNLDIRFKTVNLNNYHITLLFIGAVTELQIRQLINIGDLIKANSFDVNLTNLDFWPKPQVLFLKPQVTPIALERLFKQLLRFITDNKNELKLQNEPMVFRTYQPHVTLARKAKYLPSIAQNKISRSCSQEPRFSVTFDTFSLFESVSTSSGVKYQILKSWPLI